MKLPEAKNQKPKAKGQKTKYESQSKKNNPTHGLENNQDAPLGTGIAILAALGGAYLVGKKRKEE